MDFCGIFTERYFDLGAEQSRLRFKGPKESELNC